MIDRLSLLLHGCQREHVPEYVDSDARVARLDRLREGVMSSWEGALVFGDGNYLNRTYAPMVVGLVEVARLAEQLAEHPGNEQLRDRLRAAITRYLRDVDTAKAAEQRDAARKREREEEAAAQRQALADRAAVERDNAIAEASR